METETISVNGGFIGIVINDGLSEIQMSFETPYLKEGAALTATGFLIMAYLFLVEKRKTKSTH